VHWDPPQSPSSTHVRPSPSHVVASKKEGLGQSVDVSAAASFTAAASDGAELLQATTHISRSARPPRLGVPKDGANVMLEGYALCSASAGLFKRSITPSAASIDPAGANAGLDRSTRGASTRQIESIGHCVRHGVRCSVRASGQTLAERARGRRAAPAGILGGASSGRTNSTRAGLAACAHVVGAVWAARVEAPIARETDERRAARQVGAARCRIA
jgi:hypothetical protein